MLTTGIDTFPGTDKADLIKATVNHVSATSNTGTLSSLDEIDGGAGVDTLLIQDISSLASGINLEVATIKNVEIIEIQSVNDVDADASANALDVSGIAGLNTLNVTKAKAVDVKAAATTDVNVSGITGTTAVVEVTGGKTVTVNHKMDSAGDAISVQGAVNVDVTATDVTDTTAGINVGTGTAVTGTVNVTSTGAAITATTASYAMDAIAVKGGTTISVTQKATSDSSAAAINKVGPTITQGAVTITAGNATTTVTVKQDAAVTAVVAAATTGGVTETASVKFGALKKGDVLIIDADGDDTFSTGDLKLTATADMTAAEVAAAFANLSEDAVIPTTATGDTQGSAAASKGIFSGSINGWTTGAASGDTVVFTSTTENSNETDIDFILTDSAPLNDSVAPKVTTTDGKGHNATITGGVIGVVAGKVNVTGEAALTTVTVDGYNTAGSDISGGTNTALATINLSNGGAMTIDSAASTLALNLDNVTSTVNVKANTTTINAKVDGDSTAIIESATVKTLNVTAGNGEFTTDASSTATAGALKAATAISTVGFTGTANVTLDGATTTYTGGASVDNVTVDDADTAIAKAIDLGAGDDKLILSEAGAVKVPTVELKGGTGTDTLSIDAASAVSLSGATLFAAKLNSFERLEITGATGIQDINVKNLGFASYVTVAGVATTGGPDVLTLNNLANNATVVINADVTGAVTNGVKAVIEGSTAGEADVLNVEITNDITNDSNITFGTLNADKIETVNLTATDVFVDSSVPKDGKDNFDATHTMIFTSDTTTALNVAGTAGLKLTVTTASKLVTIDASKMTEGGLTVTANGTNAMTITGGAGNDVLTASATKADILIGGAGNDTLFAGANGAKLTGGAGNDLFVLSAGSFTSGTKEATTHSYITDFKAGDLLQLKFWGGDADNNGAIDGSETGAITAITSFSKLAANQSANAVYTDYVNAAMQQMNTGTAGEAVWFSFAGNSYVIVDSGAASTGTFTNGEDLAIELTGVANLNGASFNSDFGTIAL